MGICRCSSGFGCNLHVVVVRVVEPFRLEIVTLPFLLGYVVIVRVVLPCFVLLVVLVPLFVERIVTCWVLRGFVAMLMSPRFGPLRHGASRRQPPGAGWVVARLPRRTRPAYSP